MPISIKDFKEGNFEKRKIQKGTQIQQILEFLKKNYKNAYSVDDLVKALKIIPGTVRHALRKLKKEEEVVHDTPYYAYNK